MKIKEPEHLVTAWLAKKPQRPLLIVIGPTASGKTPFAIELAKKFDGEIVNADSRQIYQELDIGSAPPSAEEMQEIPHHLVATHSPRETISVAKYRRLAEEKILDIQKRKKLPILAGGHTLLISAIVENFQFPGKADEERRSELMKIWGEEPKKLHDLLQKLDPDAAKKIPANNQHHLIRCIERAENSEKPKTSKCNFDYLIIGLNPDREALYENINLRVDKMMQAGLLDETKNLAKKYDRYCPALRGHGYRELLDYLNGEKTLEKAVEEIKRDTRNCAKRQMTWWRNCRFAEEIHWLE